MKIFKIKYVNKNGAAISYLTKEKSREDAAKRLKGYYVKDLEITELSKEYYDDVDLTTWDNISDDMMDICEND